MNTIFNLIIKEINTFFINLTHPLFYNLL